MKKLLPLMLAGCAGLPTLPEPTPSPSPGPTPTPSTSVSEIVSEARSSACAAISWGVKGTGSERGTMFKAATAGITLSYARSVCQIKEPHVAIVASGKLGSTSPGSKNADQLAYMKPVFDKAGIPVDKGGVDTLRAVYASFFSFASMESSGKHCDGKDAAATNTSAETCEAGMFQTSYNSMAYGVPELKALYADYKAKKKSCFYDVYSSGVTCSESRWKNWGTGEGVTFQKMNKECPAFATEYAAIMFRTQRSHYYPLNQAGKPEKYAQKWIDPRPECVSLLKSVEAKISPALCEALK